MDEFRKDSSSTTTPIKPSGIPRISSTSDLKQKISSRKEINENEEDLQNQTGSKLQNPKKPTPMTKHFMSPTISAASKVTTPKKKILMERNQTSESIFSDTQFQKRSQEVEFGVSSANLGLEYSSQITPLSPKFSKSEENGIDSTSQAYDPLTNYLSPRPKFLRYNPNRRLEILLRRETELKQGEKDGLAVNQFASLEPKKGVEEESPSDASSSQEDGSSFCNEESDSKKTSENEVSDDSESEFEDDQEVEEVEDEEEEKGNGWNLKQVLKFVFLLGIVVISTFYISFMNSPNPPTPLQALLDLKEGYQISQNSLFQAGLDNSVLWDTNQELLMEATGRNYEVGKKEEEESEKLGEISDKMDEISELNEVEKNQDLMESTERVEDEGLTKEVLVEEELEQSGGTSNQFDEILDMREGKDAEISEVLQVSHNQFVPDTTGDAYVVNEKLSTSEVEEYTDKEETSGVEVPEEDESTSQIELEEDEASQSFELNQLPTENVTDEEVEKEEMVEDEMEKTVVVDDGRHEEMTEVSETSEDPQTQFAGDDENIRSGMPIASEKEIISDRGQIELLKVVSNTEVGIGISILFVIVASSVLGFLRLYRRKPTAREASPTIKPSVEPVPPKKQDNSIEEKIERTKKLYLPKKEETIEDQIEKADSFIPSSSVHSGGKFSKDIYRSRITPTVELLGEFMVEESGSSLKSCSLMKSKTMGEESNFSVSISEKKSRGRRTSSVNQDNPSLSEFSVSGSPSYGSFTTEEMIFRKEKQGGKDGEEIVKILTTPVRRSNRIRSKTVVSP